MVRQLPLDGTDLRLRRLTAEDVASGSSALQTLRALLLECRPMYPRIGEWFDRKVSRGISSGERAAFIAYAGAQPVATAVVKVVNNAKFCHLRIIDDLQDVGVGMLFFSLMALESRRAGPSCHIRFTLPESLGRRRQDFFTGFGFSEAVKAGTQYRMFDQELKCSAPYERVWRSALNRLTKLSERFAIAGRSLQPDLLMSIKPVHALSILDGSKRVELRRQFNRKWAGSRMAIYATAPEQALVGDACIEEVITAPPERIWQDFGSQLGCSRGDFDAYVTGTPKISALLLRDVRSYFAPIPKAQLEYHVGGAELRAPQSFSSSESDENWAKALCVATLLQASAPAASAGTNRPFVRSIGHARADQLAEEA